jgi:lactate 2-monooxygenase
VSVTAVDADARVPSAPTTSALADYQNEIYLGGLGGQPPRYPVDSAGLEAAAYAVMTPEAVGYVAGGAGAEQTMRANREAFDHWRILPRMLRGIVARDLRTEVLGTRMPAPVLLAPVGVQSIIHPEGELASARAAAGLGVPFIHSTAASHSIEAVARASGDGPRWYQLYWPRDRELAASLLHRAEAAGYTAVVVTLDTWTLGWRPRDLATAYLPFLRGIGIANYTSDPVFRAALADAEPMTAVRHWLDVFADPALTWADLGWLRETTEVPVVVKGICSSDDARRAVDAGVDALVVSNHGGRQVDGAVAALDALPAVVDTVGRRLPVLFDSGVRTGADVVKALALGAAAVLVGRPYLWGLALGGADGVRHVLRCLLGELDNVLALSGHARPADLGPQTLVATP